MLQSPPFQSNRMTRGPKVPKRAKPIPSLPYVKHGNSLALPGIVAALLENGQTEDGIKLPEVLVLYFGKTGIQYKGFEILWL